jgi:uncharacterized protein (DUF1800 family)
MALTPFSGTWDAEKAAHLLRRALFGPTFNQIQKATQEGLSTTIDALLILPSYSKPLSISDVDTITPKGKTWVDKVYPADSNTAQMVQNARNESLASWSFENIHREGYSIAEKMSLFWQNHFAAEFTNDARATYNYIHLLKVNALGNFKELVKKVTVDPCMLLFLNGNSNTKNSPNENYSRELLELFTVGKGTQVGTGDYTNFTEEDIKQGAKILTGWNVKGMLSSVDTTPSAIYLPNKHDKSSKTLSQRFNNATITNGEQNEYANYIDVIFSTDKAAQYICKKIYRWFVNYDITPEIQSQIIDPMASLMVNSNYEVLPVIKALLTSEHFFDISVRGTIIKNPIEFIFSLFNSTETQFDFGLDVNYDFYKQIYGFSAVIGINYFRPPSVGGWPAYYQVPSYSRLWMNSSYIKLRFDIAGYLLTNEFKATNDKTKFCTIDVFTFVKNLSAPTVAQSVIDDFTLVFCPKSLSQSKKDELRLILTGGQPDFEWTLQYNEYLADPTDVNKMTAIQTRIRLVLDSIFKLPEFQTF